MERMQGSAREALEERRRFLRLALTGRAVGIDAGPSVTDTEGRELEEIEAALERLDTGTWGRCEACGRAIGRQRLRALPETRWCIDCASTQDPRR